MLSSASWADRLRAAVPLLAGAAAAVAVAGVHVTQGTAEVGAAELLRLLTGSGDDSAWAVLVASRLPRLLAGVLVGAALGVSGLLLQTVSRNILASPDTVAVNAGAYLAVAAVTVFAVHLPILAGGAVAFAGGLLAAGLVLALAAGGGGPVRLVLAGSALSLAFAAVTTGLLLLHPERTIGLLAWSQGSLAQTNLDAVRQLGPVVAVCLALAMAVARTLDLLGLGEDAASVLGQHVGRTRLVAVLLAVALAAAAVTVAGPIGFLGLAAPATARLLAGRVRGLHRHALLIPTAAVLGIVLVLGADVLLRLAFGSVTGLRVPTGVVTTIVGAGFLVVLALRTPALSHATTPGLTTARAPRRPALLVATAAALLLGVMLTALLLGDTTVLGGDVLNWATGKAGRLVTFVLDTRAPRVLAAALAGAALAAAGTVVQAVTRNPLAEPGILGVTGGSGVGAVLVITASPFASFAAVTGGGLAGAALAALLVFGLAASGNGGLPSSRLILVGLGISAAASAAVAMLLVATDPYNQAKAMTWLSGSTYGREPAHLLPVAIAVAVLLPLLFAARRELDMVALDDDTPRLLGVRLGRSRWWLLTAAVALAGTATAAVGVIGFVGLVAPHAARLLAGSRHRVVLPLAALLGALLTCVADTLGRTVIAPGQLPAGLLTAAVGAPYFVWLLWRSRRTV